MKKILKYLKYILYLLLILALLLGGFIGYTLLNRNIEVSSSGTISNGFYRLIQPKRFLNRLLENPKRIDTPLTPSEKFSNTYRTQYKNLNGNELITANLENPTDVHIIYLHGGAYILGKEGMTNREKIMGDLIDNTFGKVTFFDYPVAPESQYSETIEALNTAYQYLIETYPEDRFIFVGDSAGGGLALSYGQMISDEAIKQPEKYVLFSPWLDVSMSNADIAPLEELDMLLSKEDLLQSAIKYAGSENLKNPLISPLYGDFNGLGEILMFYGTHELLYADAMKLEDLSDLNDYDITFNYYEEMQHVWILLPIEETNKAMLETYDFILSK